MVAAASSDETSSRNLGFDDTDGGLDEDPLDFLDDCPFDAPPAEEPAEQPQRFQETVREARAAWDNTHGIRVSDLPAKLLEILRLHRADLPKHLSTAQAGDLAKHACWRAALVQFAELLGEGSEARLPSKLALTALEAADWQKTRFFKLRLSSLRRGFREWLASQLDPRMKKGGAGPHRITKKGR